MKSLFNQVRVTTELWLALKRRMQCYYYASAPDAFVWRLSDVWHLSCLSDVCRVIGPNSRTERPRKTKIGTEVANVTRDSDTSFNIKGELVADVLNSQYAGIGATWWINTKILSTCRGQRHIVSPRAQLVFPCRPCEKTDTSAQSHRNKVIAISSPQYYVVSADNKGQKSNSSERYISLITDDKDY